MVGHEEAELVEMKCDLLDNTFGVIVQAALAVAAIATLVYKRQTERPRRDWKVWFFDASKQAWAGFLQHMVNLSFGIIFASQSNASECAWYIMNFTISVFCGIVLLHGAMYVWTMTVDYFHPHLQILRSGEYGSPPRWTPWAAQLLLWGFIASFEKLITAAAVIYPLHKHLDGMGAWLEKPFRPYPKIELLLVMVAAPILLNILFFWAIDNIIKRRRPVHGKGDDVMPLLDDDSCCPRGMANTNSSHKR